MDHVSDSYVSTMLPAGGAEQEAIARAFEAVASVAASIANESDPRQVAAVVVEQLEQLGARACGVYLYNSGRDTLEMLAHSGANGPWISELTTIPMDGPFLIAHAARERRLLHLDETHADLLPGTARLLEWTGSTSAVAMPLVAGDDLVGATIWTIAERRAFSGEELRALQALGNIFATALRAATTRRRELRLRSLLESVGRASVRIAEATDLAGVLQALADESRKVVGARYAAVGLVDTPDRPFGTWVSSGISREQALRLDRAPRPVGLLGATALRGERIRIRDLTRDPRFRGFPPGYPPMHSLLGCPLLSRGRPIGSLFLAEKLNAPEFDEHDEWAIELLANQAALLIEREQLFARIDAERRWLETVVEISPVGMLLVSPGHVRANRRAEELMRRPIDPDQGSRQYVQQIFTPEGVPVAYADLPSSRAMRGAATPSAEYLLRRVDGTEIPVLLGAAPIRGRGGEPEGAVVAFEDITTLKELQRLREEWTAVVAHDLRQPVAVLLANAQLLERELRDRPEARRVAHIVSSGRQLDRMIADLLDTSRIEADRLTLEKRDVDTSPFLRAVAERRAPMLGDHRLIVRVPAGLPTLHVDPVRIEQVIGNLLSNAAKYGEPGTPIRLAAERRRDGVAVTVCNEGHGIAPDELPLLFERFHRTRASRASGVPGIGLGLYITRGLVAAHGGRVWVESEPNATTTFGFVLPAADPLA